MGKKVYYHYFFYLGASKDENLKPAIVLKGALLQQWISISDHGFSGAESHSWAVNLIGVV